MKTRKNLEKTQKKNLETKLRNPPLPCVIAPSAISRALLPPVAVPAAAHCAAVPNGPCAVVSGAVSVARCAVSPGSVNPLPVLILRCPPVAVSHVVSCAVFGNLVSSAVVPRTVSCFMSPSFVAPSAVVALGVVSPGSTRVVPCAVSVVNPCVPSFVMFPRVGGWC